MRVGSATVDVTPDWSLPLAGFGARTLPSQGVSEPLHVRAALIASIDEAGDERRALIVSADILWWGPQQVPALRSRLAGIAGVAEHAILFSATHSHSGPQTSERAASGIGVLDPRFETLLAAQTEAAVRQAVSDLEPVTVIRHDGVHALGFNRRLAFDPDGPEDPALVVVAFVRPDGRPKTLLVHYTCHPVITEEPLLSGEFPGVAMGCLGKDLGVDALFLQGCCGDINPIVHGRRQTERGDAADVERIGGELASAVKALLGQPGRDLVPVPIAAVSEVVALRFAAVPTVDDLHAKAGEAGVTGEWARALLAHPAWREPSIALEVQRIDLAAGLSLLAMNGEIVVAYGLLVRALSNGDTLPVAYANGMTGYIPTERILAEGGYEAGDAGPWFLLPAPFATGIEDQLTTVLKRRSTPTPPCERSGSGSPMPAGRSCPVVDITEEDA